LQAGARAWLTFRGTQMTYRARKRDRKRRGGPLGKIMLAVTILGSLVAIAVLGTGLWVLSIAADTPGIDQLNPIETGSGHPEVT